MRLRRNRIFLAIIIVMVGLAASALTFRTIDIPGVHRGSEEGPLGLRLGLDLQGGTHLVYRADDPNVTSEQMDGLVSVIERRINSFGVSEPLIQKKGNNEIVIQLPGVRDIDEAKALIGGTAQLDFRQCVDPTAISRATCPGWEQATGEGSGGVIKHLTGEFMRPNSFVGPDPGTGLPVVSFEFNREGARIFEQITRRLLGRPLGIFLDDQLISAPIIQAVISSQGRITGISRSEGERLSIQLNAGALPVSIRVVREQDVSATLGEDSLRKSYIAAAIGLGLVMMFMMAYYRMLGVVAAFSLIIYTVLVMAIFKFLEITLTLSGIAAFVISVGMAVDANVIIFERMREELRSGRSLSASIETGFDRAWSAIRDGNVTTLLVMAILWWFGDQLGEPKVIGFALTMIIAVSTSMFVAFFVTRTFLRLLVGTPMSRRMTLFADVKDRESPSLGL